MKKLFLVLAMVVFLVSGCAIFTRPTALDLRNADYGPCPDNYEELIREVYDTQLFDPYSAVYTFNKFCKGWEWLHFGITPRFGWIVCGTLNSKNRFGGYVGARPFYVFIQNGQVIKEIFLRDLRPGGRKVIRLITNRCRSCKEGLLPR